jgi:hypothetical protein
MRQSYFSRMESNLINSDVPFSQLDALTSLGAYDSAAVSVAKPCYLTAHLANCCGKALSEGIPHQSIVRVLCRHGQTADKIWTVAQHCTEVQLGAFDLIEEFVALDIPSTQLCALRLHHPQEPIIHTDAEPHMPGTRRVNAPDTPARIKRLPGQALPEEVVSYRIPRISG